MNSSSTKTHTDLAMRKTIILKCYLIAGRQSILFPRRKHPMTKMLRRLTGSLVLSACLLLPPFLLPRFAAADPVRLVVDGRGLDGELHLASGRTIRDGVMVLVHGTLAHNRMEIMQMLQETIGERGLSTLAVTLSMGGGSEERRVGEEGVR